MEGKKTIGGAGWFKLLGKLQIYRTEITFCHILELVLHLSNLLQSFHVGGSGVIQPGLHRCQRLSQPVQVRLRRLLLHLQTLGSCMSRYKQTPLRGVWGDSVVSCLTLSSVARLE